jgi:hypothetical protein
LTLQPIRVISSGVWHVDEDEVEVVTEVDAMEETVVAETADDR